MLDRVNEVIETHLLCTIQMLHLSARRKRFITSSVWWCIGILGDGLSSNHNPV